MVLESFETLIITSILEGMQIDLNDRLFGQIG
jgi:hypothetical protein